MKILVPVDGSAASEAALDFVAARSACLGTRPELRLLNVQQPIPPRAASAVGREVVRGYQRSEAAAILDPALRRLKAAGLSPKARHAVGSPGAVVARAAVHGHPDLVVMGARGRTALQGLVLGSVTQSVLAASRTPLLIVHEGRPAVPDSLRVAVAVDGSRDCLAAVRFVLANLEFFGPSPRFSLLHVAADPKDDASFDAAVRTARTLFSKAGVEAQPVRLDGPNPGDAIAACLVRSKADLVVMGSHGRGAFKALILGSVAMRVAARSRLPMLLVRAGTGGPRTAAAARKAGG